MLLNKIKQGFTRRGMRYLNERRGWRTNRKIVVIESDDWGSIRMPNKIVFERMLKLNYEVHRCNYSRYDTLASQQDFSHLFDVLSSFKDGNGNHPIITANTIVANPDFEKIRENDFQKYFYEPFTKTLKRYPNHSFEYWKEGISNKLFHPQLHGREHLNVDLWLKRLRAGSKELHLAFDNRFFGISAKVSKESQSAIVAAFNGDSLSFREIIYEAADLFQDIFNYRSKSFIAPNYYWDDLVEEALSQKGVKFIQGALAQRHPLRGNIFHYTGERSKKINELVYLKRNVYFEPSSLIKRDWVANSLYQIERAFYLKKPAIICSHRVNYIGGLVEKNRIENLQSLKLLLSNILMKWPDVEFMTSDELGELIDTPQFFDS